jgi:hypothetical protein
LCKSIYNGINIGKKVVNEVGEQELSKREEYSETTERVGI